MTMEDGLCALPTVLCAECKHCSGHDLQLSLLGSLTLAVIACRRIWAGSEDRLNIQFNPAALLSLGDAHAFVQALLDIAPKAPGVPRGGPTPSTVSTNTKMAQLDSGPEIGEQMAQRGAITSRSV